VPEPTTETWAERAWRKDFRQLEGPQPVILFSVPSAKGDPPVTARTTHPAEVISVEDLPPRFLMGDLQASSFQPSDTGWSVRYEGSPGSGADLAWNGDSLRFSLTWREERWGPYFYSGPWPRSAQVAAGGFPPNWNNEAARWIEENYNARYVPVGNTDAALLCGFPDGYMVTIACFLPVSRMRAVLDLQRRSKSDPLFPRSLHFTAAIAWTAVNYLLDRNPRLSLDPLAMLTHWVGNSGMPVTHLPVVETAPNGSQAITCRGLHYYLLAGCVWRDLEASIAYLHKFGLVGPASDGPWEERPPLAPEYGAVVFQSGIEVQPVEVSFMDRDQTRRVLHLDFAPESYIPLMPSLLSSTTDEVDRQVEAVEHFSHDYMQRLQGGLQQAMHR